jgi:hypothetical protein
MGVRQRWKKMIVAGGVSMTWCSVYGGGKIKTQLNGGESDQGWDDLFIAVESESRVVQREWSTDMVWIQCFSFSSRGEAIGWNIIGRWSKGNELILAPWEGSVTQCVGVVMSVGGETTPVRGNGGDDASWNNVIFTGPKNVENQRGRFRCYKWTINI